MTTTISQVRSNGSARATFGDARAKTQYFVRFLPGKRPVEAVKAWETRKKVCLLVPMDDLPLEKSLWSGKRSSQFLVFDRATSKQVDGRAFYFKGGERAGKEVARG